MVRIEFSTQGEEYFYQQSIAFHELYEQGTLELSTVHIEVTWTKRGHPLLLCDVMVPGIGPVPYSLVAHNQVHATEETSSSNMFCVFMRRYAHDPDNAFAFLRQVAVVYKLAKPEPLQKPVWNAGPKKVFKQKQALLQELAEKAPSWYALLQLLCSDKTEKKVTNNQLIAAFLEQVSTLEEVVGALLKALHWITQQENKYGWYEVRSVLEQLPGAQEKLAEKAQAVHWTQQQEAVKQAAILGITEATPVLQQVIQNQQVRVSVFHEPGQVDTPVNREYVLIEQALNQWPETILAILEKAATRTTYTKAITPYLAFLYKLPVYLQRHAPRSPESPWFCTPKLVDTTWELEMGEGDEQGTTTKRSALTPVVNNLTGEVIVPYAAIRIAGEQTSYCYSERYYVQEAMHSDPLGLGVFTRDLAEKLNGRDDYGMMFYTLTGTPSNRGYPAFLVIFERLQVPQPGSLPHGKSISTRVHLHRVKPCRFKNQHPVPSDMLIEECYRYMAGNIQASEILAQQGDLLLKAGKPGKVVGETYPIASFENHSFQSHVPDHPVLFTEAAAKDRDNLLGWLQADASFSMPHPEHEHIHLPAGTYALLRCKSFERNPIGSFRRYVD
jgi:hypothetical protein